MSRRRHKHPSRAQRDAERRERALDYLEANMVRMRSWYPELGVKIAERLAHHCRPGTDKTRT